MSEENYDISVEVMQLIMLTEGEKKKSVTTDHI